MHLYARYLGSDILDQNNCVDTKNGDIRKVIGKHLENGYVLLMGNQLGCFWASEDKIELLNPFEY